MCLIPSASFTKNYVLAERLGGALPAASMQTVAGNILTIPDTFVNLRPAIWAAEILCDHDVSEWLYIPVIHDLIDVARWLIAVLLNHLT